MDKDNSIHRAYRGDIAVSLLVQVVIAVVVLASNADAGEIEPRAYGNTPVGVNFFIASYSYSAGGLSTAASVPIQDAQLRIDTGILAYARTFEVWGKPGKFDVILPFSFLSGTASVDGTPRERTISGYHDPRFRFSVNFLGAPVLSVKEFAGYRQDLIIGASVQVSAPLGQYDPDKLVNLGNNRWFVKPDIGISKAWGELTLEISTGVILYSRNDKFFGGRTLDQDPVSTSQIHLMYNFRPGLWAAVSGTYDYGGRTTVNGVQRNDRQGNSRVGATVGVSIDRNNSVKLYASTGVSTRTGSNYDLLGIAWQYRWGSGL